MFRPMLALCLLTVSTAARADEDPNWQRLKLDETFRAEGVAAADVDHDGRLDVLAGELWYQAPDWTKHEIRPPGKYVGEKGYSQCFACWAHDVNGDGWADFIVVGFPGAPCHWYQNPQGQPGHWKQHVIWHSACNESPEFEDVDGDGKPELVLGSQPEGQMGFLPLPPPEKATAKWDFHAVSQEKSIGTHRYYHGLGVGDLDGDGRRDILIPHGWWKAPKNEGGEWTFHPLSLNPQGKEGSLAAANMYVDDLDRDGDNDILMSSAHNYGIWWFENAGDDTTFTDHEIDKHYSQTHALEYVDMNGDGQRDLVTGKRFFAHQGHDPGGKEPVVMDWYEVHRKKGGPEFVPHEIVAGRETGIGTQFLVKDMNGDEKPDIVLSNKKGVNVLLQRPAE